MLQRAATAEEQGMPGVGASAASIQPLLPLQANPSGAAAQLKTGRERTAAESFTRKRLWGVGGYNSTDLTGMQVTQGGGGSVVFLSGQTEVLNPFLLIGSPLLLSDWLSGSSEEELDEAFKNTDCSLLSLRAFSFISGAFIY